jgi:hypothetical protein
MIKAMKRKPKHPMQPVYLADDGCYRFKPNKIIQYLFERGGLDLNLLATMQFSEEDRTQIAMLLGYSVSGAGDLDYFDWTILERADKEADRQSVARGPNKRVRP